MANAERLTATLAYIEAHPEEHDQETWHCGTRFCFAGHAAVTLAGAHLHRPDLLEDDVLELTPQDFQTIPELSNWYYPGEKAHIFTYALVYLDLTPVEADRLFNGRNSLADLQKHVTDLITYWS